MPLYETQLGFGLSRTVVGFQPCKTLLRENLYRSKLDKGLVVFQLSLLKRHFVLLPPVFLRNFRLHWYHCVGSMTGFLGAALMVTGSQIQLDSSDVLGYIFAVTAALLWAVYSLLTKRVAPFSTGAVGGFCLMSGLLSLGVHFVAEPFYAPSSREWILLFLLGCGPLGIAYFTWDSAMKKGDPRIIGSLCYLTPLLSTFILVLLGGRELLISTSGLPWSSLSEVPALVHWISFLLRVARDIPLSRRIDRDITTELIYQVFNSFLSKNISHSARNLSLLS